jgi:BirA family transcriptional regulator, biotin operon repressor / biotin---[acetyl-CoA-carboxylase] ligase
MSKAMDKQQYLISRLADGNFHSGESLAEEMSISRAAVWKRIKSLSNYGLDVFSVHGKGYRLSRSLDILDTDKIVASLSDEFADSLKGLTVLPVLDSTNQFLYRQLNNDSFHAHVVVAEYQESGKGRRGNDWLSPYGSGICMSLGWHFQSTPASYTALSLATGVAVCRSLQRLGITNAGLKWPNDIISEGKKLGGILLESRSETAGCSDVVIGIGINVDLPEQVLNTISQAVTDTSKLTQQIISRNKLVGFLIEDLLHMLKEYQEHGFASCIQEWRQLDELKGRDADLILPNETLSGKILGIDESGLLLMLIAGETRSFSSGELSLRVHT